MNHTSVPLHRDAGGAPRAAGVCLRNPGVRVCLVCVPNNRNNRARKTRIVTFGQRPTNALGCRTVGRKLNRRSKIFLLLPLVIPSVFQPAQQDHFVSITPVPRLAVVPFAQPKAPFSGAALPTTATALRANGYRVVALAGTKRCA